MNGEKTTGILLAGGLSKRMGLEKGLIRVGDSLLYQYPLRVLQSLSQKILISTCKKLDITESHEQVCDTIPGIGPMGGLYTCLKYSDTDPNLVVPYDPALDMNNSVTIAAWVLRNGYDGGGHILAKREEYTVNYQLAFFGNVGFSDKDHRIEFGKGLPQPYPYIFSRRPKQQIGQWQHVAVTCENNIVKFYLNGTLLDTILHENPMVTSETDLLLGTDGLKNDPTTFHGLMDEIAIFRRVLTAGEIRQMYEKGCPYR